MSLRSKRHWFSSNFRSKKWTPKGLDCYKHFNMYWKFSLRSKNVLWVSLYVLKTTHSNLGGPLPKPMNMCCYIEYDDLNLSFEHNS
jgi:hypothetical protein